MQPLLIAMRRPDPRPQPILHLRRKIMHANCHAFEWYPQRVLRLYESHDSYHETLTRHVQRVRNCELLDWGEYNRVLGVEGFWVAEQGIEVSLCLAGAENQLL